MKLSGLNMHLTRQSKQNKRSMTDPPTNERRGLASHIPEPLKDVHTVNIQDETVFVLWIPFQFGNRALSAKSLIVFR